MASRPSVRILSLVLLGILPGLALGTGVGYSMAMMTSSRTLGANTFATAASFDTVAPTVSASVIAKASGTGQYFASFIKPGGTYYVYANATDGGAVPSGIATIRANVSAIAAGQTAVSLAAGSYSVEGVTYGFRSAALTAGALANGSYGYSLTSTDNAGNSGTQSGFTVTVDNTAPAGSNVKCTNGGSQVGKIELGDVCKLTFNEIIDPESVLAGWDGSSTNVVVQFTDNGSNDTYAIWNAANTAQLPLGSVNTADNYVGSNVTAGASGTPSTMVLDTATSTITITFGTISGTVNTVNANRTQTWSPSASVFDRAGNAMSTGTVNGPNAKEF